MKLFTSFAAAAVLALSTVAAQAAPIPLVAGDKFQVNFNGSDNSVANPDSWLTSSAIFEVLGLTSTTLQLKVVLTNTTAAGYDSRVAAFGFLLSALPDAASSSLTSDTYSKLNIGADVTPNAHQLATYLPGGANACATSNNCGASNEGVFRGQTATTTFNFVFASAVSGLTIDNFFVRYQSLSAPAGVQLESLSGGGLMTSINTCLDDEKDCSTNGGNNGGGDVPEPATMALVGLGLIGAGALRRRK